MSFTQMDGEKMYRSFLSGANKVISEKQVLNDINVFPVPDGDTGTNLASTMLSVIDESKADTTVKKTLESIAQAALIGAKGNSGIIFAQYIYGMSMGVGDEDRELDLEKFADSVAKAVPHAYEAIENPVEGTMITVIKDWSDSISQKWKKSKDFHELISESLKDAMRSLKDTPNKLKVLKDNAVVDSGGKGFVHFVEGFLEFVKTGQMVKSVESTYVPKIADHAHDVHEELRYRYCTEGFIEGTLDLKAIKQDLKPLGDSLIVAGGVHKSRIHIHTDEPDQVFIKLRKHGSILQQKADDMKRQYQTIHEKGASIALVTDSIADLPKEIIDRYKIHMIPLQLMIEGAAYLDKVTITSETFYDLLDEVETYPSSSQPNFAQVKSYLEFISEHYESIIVVTVAKALSGTYNTFQQAAKSLIESGKKIDIVDSRQNSGAEGLLVMKAAEMIKEGKSHEAVVETLKELRQKTKIFVSVNTLKYMVRSGRVGKVTGVAGKIINLKPVITLDESGAGQILDKAFSTASNTKKIAKRVGEAYERNADLRYVIIHAGAKKRAEEYRKLFSKRLNKKPEYIMSISPIVAMSAGVGCVAVAVME